MLERFKFLKALSNRSSSAAIVVVFDEIVQLTINKLLSEYHPMGISAAASDRRNEQTGVLIAGVAPLSHCPLLFYAYYAG